MACLAQRRGPESVPAPGGQGSGGAVPRPLRGAVATAPQLVRRPGSAPGPQSRLAGEGTEWVKILISVRREHAVLATSPGRAGDALAGLPYRLHFTYGIGRTVRRLRRARGRCPRLPRLTGCVRLSRGTRPAPTGSRAPQAPSSCRDSCPRPDHFPRPTSAVRAWIGIRDGSRATPAGMGWRSPPRWVLAPIRGSAHVCELPPESV
jgi:hypothetical protein